MKTEKLKFASFLFAVVLSFSFAGCATVASQQVKVESANAAPTATPPNADDQIKRNTSEPYTGELSIFESEKREENLQINRVMEILKIRDNANVADIGAGSGWFTTRAARKTKGTVYAVEINQDYINHINDRAGKENLLNIKTVLGTEEDPKLPEKTIDAALILKTYHEIGEPVRVMKNLKKALRPGALVGVIDREGNGEDHGIKSETVISEMKQAGFALENNYDFVKPDGMDYFLVFRAK